MILMIAKFGGFLGRKSDGHPGTKVMWIGMQRMKDFTLAWRKPFMRWNKTNLGITICPSIRNSDSFGD